MNTGLKDCTELHNGVKMPWLGLGVWRTEEGQQTLDAVGWALEHGYRHIDTASIYGNEHGVGVAIRRSKVPREELFVTSKVWNSDQGYDGALRAFEETMRKLDLPYLDLYLVHWPVQGKFTDTWRALEELYETGRVRAIGVSNFHKHHLEALLETARIAPMVNQVEFHPRLQQPDLHAFCRDQHIQLEAWAPIMKGQVNEIPELQEIARKHEKTPIQVTLRWELQREVVVIPKSVRRERIQENAHIFDFTLSPEEIEQINQLDQSERVGPDPDNFDF